jgi:glycosyltransferase involved in cell wall biosynthesis
MSVGAEKKTLLVATDSFLPRWDGIARFLYEVLPFMKDSFNIVVAAPDFSLFDSVVPDFPEGLSEFKGIEIVRFPIYKKKIADTYAAKIRPSKIVKLVRNADIVWSQSIGPIGALSMYYAKKNNKPLISFVHSVEWYLFSKSLKRFRNIMEFTIRKSIPFIYNKCDIIIVPFEGMIPLLEEQNINVKKEVVYLGVNTDKFSSSQSKVLAKEKLSMDPNRVVIGYLGRFGREKDIQTLYEAFRKLQQDKPNTTLLLVGGEIKFEHMENIRVFGSVNNPVPYYQAMDIYVLPSLTETTSLTTMEAMSCSLPVVVTPVGYVEKYVKHKENGFIFPFKSSERLYLILKKLVSDSHLRNDIGRAARKTMTEKHTWKMTAEEILKILNMFG